MRFTVQVHPVILPKVGKNRLHACVIAIAAACVIAIAACVIAIAAACVIAIAACVIAAACTIIT